MNATKEIKINQYKRLWNSLYLHYLRERSCWKSDCWIDLNLSCNVRNLLTRMFCGSSMTWPLCKCIYPMLLVLSLASPQGKTIWQLCFNHLALAVALDSVTSLPSDILLFAWCIVLHFVLTLLLTIKDMEVMIIITRHETSSKSSTVYGLTCPLLCLKVQYPISSSRSSLYSSWSTPLWTIISGC